MLLLVLFPHIFLLTQYLLFFLYFHLHSHLLSLPHHLLLLQSKRLCLYFFGLSLELVFLFDRLLLLLFLDHLYHLAHYIHLVLFCFFKLPLFFMFHLFTFLYEFTEYLIYLFFDYDTQFRLNLLINELVDLRLRWLQILRLRLDSLILVCIVCQHCWLSLIGSILLCLFFFHLCLIILYSFYERSRSLKSRIWHMELCLMRHLFHFYGLLRNLINCLSKCFGRTVIINKPILKKIFRKTLNVIQILKLCLVHSLITYGDVLTSLVVLFKFLQSFIDSLRMVLK